MTFESGMLYYDIGNWSQDKKNWYKVIEKGFFLSQLKYDMMKFCAYVFVGDGEENHKESKRTYV